jgi:hypothetical protein
MWLILNLRSMSDQSSPWWTNLPHSDSTLLCSLLSSRLVTLAEARECWWITFGGHLVSGGHPDRERMARLTDEKYPGCLVQQGSEFIPPAGQEASS